MYLPASGQNGTASLWRLPFLETTLGREPQNGLGDRHFLISVGRILCRYSSTPLRPSTNRSESYRESSPAPPVCIALVLALFLQANPRNP